MTQTTSKWKIHVLFASLLLLAFTITLLIKLFEGAGMIGALKGAALEAKPAEVILFIALWYCAATGRLQGERRSHLIELNLKDKQPERRA
jgi:hypothetical protein